MFMERQYKQLSLEERDRITDLKAGGFSLRAIAEALGRSPSTIIREVRRNSSPAYMLYMSHRAHDRAVRRKEEAAKRPRLKDKETAIICPVRSFLLASPLSR